MKGHLFPLPTMPMGSFPNALIQRILPDTQVELGDDGGRIHLTLPGLFRMNDLEVEDTQKLQMIGCCVNDCKNISNLLSVGERTGDNVPQQRSCSAQ